MTLTQRRMQVAKVVAPKKARLAEAEASYQEVMVGLTAKQAELQVMRYMLVSSNAASCHRMLTSDVRRCIP